MVGTIIRWFTDCVQISDVDYRAVEPVKGVRGTTFSDSKPRGGEFARQLTLICST